MKLNIIQKEIDKHFKKKGTVVSARTQKALDFYRKRKNLKS